MHPGPVRDDASSGAGVRGDTGSGGGDRGRWYGAFWAVWIMEPVLDPSNMTGSPGPWVFALREVEGVIGSWSVAVTMGPCS